MEVPWSKEDGLWVFEYDFFVLQGSALTVTTAMNAATTRLVLLRPLFLPLLAHADGTDIKYTTKNKKNKCFIGL